MEYTVQEFKEWLARNNNHLRGYAPNQIVALAIACGFDVNRICGPVSDHKAHLRRLEAFWESCSDNGLGELWLHLVRLERGTEDSI